MAKTVVGLMASSREADSVARELMHACGCDRADIGVATGGTEGARGRRGDEVASGAMQGAGTGAAVGGALGLIAGAASLAIPGFGPILAAGPIASALAGAGLGGATGGLIGALTRAGIPEDEAGYYEEGLKRGGTLLTVHAATDEMARCAAAVMERGGQGADERAPASAERKTMPLAEEELVVGKREVSGGSVRIYTHVIEQPAQATVELREEHVSVERRPVDRPAQLADQAFKEQTIEVRETAEEAVVTKRARVVEEVVVRKEQTTRVETIQDSVRKTDVRVERIGDPKRSAGRSAYQGAERRKNHLPYNGEDRRRYATA
jgi:uncharacterized protein (TIGR02271 family)